METIVGSGKYTYKEHEDWAKVPAGVDMKPAAVAVDPHDRIYCFNRSSRASRRRVRSRWRIPVLLGRGHVPFPTRHPIR